MNAARLTFKDNGLAIAVAVRFMGDPVAPNFRHTHAGLCYRDKGSLWLLHLAWDRKLCHEPFDGSYVCAVPRIRPRRLRFFLRLCLAMRDKRPTLRYALRHPDNARFLIQSGGDVVLTKGGAGLNCSTFVLVFFQSYGFPLIDLATWRTRSEDAEWHRHLVGWVARTDTAQAALIASEVGCARIRPEETAGACLEDRTPVAFAECEANGRSVLQVLDGWLTQAEHEEAKRIAYDLACARGGGQEPPWDKEKADEDFSQAAAEVVRRRPHSP